MKNLIFVTGAVRSGTSLVAGSLYHAGAWGMDERRDDMESRIFFYGDDKNPKGYFEHNFLIDDLEHAARKKGAVNLQGRKTFEETVASIAARHSVPDDRPVFLKGYSFIAFDGGIGWQRWREAFPQAKWVVVRRDAEDINRSCIRKYKRSDDLVHSKGRVLRSIPKLLADFDRAGTDYFEIWPFEEIDDPKLVAFKALVSWAGLEWNDAVEEFIDPNLCHFPPQHKLAAVEPV